MATRKTTTTAATAAAKPAAKQRRAFDMNDALQLLLEKATGSEKLTSDDLKYLVEGRQDARRLAGYAARVAEGIGCLANEDTSAGNFKGGDDFFDLMLLFGGVFRQIEALSELSEMAEFTLTEGEQHV